MRRRVAVFTLGLLAVASLLTISTLSNSAGAPRTAAQDGCTCHGVADPAVKVQAQLPERYEAGATYNGTLTVQGGPMVLPVQQNQGGFALSASAGRFEALAGTQADGDFLTHTAQGNDQRSWAFRWVAPSPAVGDVLFSFAGNAVNGDGTSSGGLDHWNRSNVTAAGPAASASGTSASTKGAGGSPGLDVVWVVLAIGLTVALGARRR